MWALGVRVQTCVRYRDMCHDVGHTPRIGLLITLDIQCACIGLAYVVMAYTVMAYVVMAY